MADFTPETPEEFEMQWDAQNPDGEHVYMGRDEEGNIDVESASSEAPYDTGEDEDGDEESGVVDDSDDDWLV